MNTIFGIDNLLNKLQGEGTLFWDTFFSTYSNIYIWIPMLFVLFCILIKNNTIKNFMLVIGILFFIVILSEFAVTPLLEFLSGNNSWNLNVISSHTTDILSIVLFISYIIKKKSLTTSLLLWTVLNIYSGIYLNEFSSGDITLSVIFGIAIGISASLLYKFIRKKQRSANRDWISTQYTKSGYLVSDVHFLLVMLYGTIALVPIISFL